MARSAGMSDEGRATERVSTEPRREHLGDVTTGACTVPDAVAGPQRSPGVNTWETRRVVVCGTPGMSPQRSPGVNTWETSKLADESGVLGPPQRSPGVNTWETTILVFPTEETACLNGAQA